MKITLLIVFLAIAAFNYWMRHINLQHLKRHGSTVPAEFEGIIDEQRLATSSSYTVASSRLSLWGSLLDNLLLVWFLFGGLITTYDRFINHLTTSALLMPILFFMLLSCAQALLGIPFSLYRTFVLEERYGFNKTSAALWLKDFIKSMGLGAVLLSVMVGVIFALIRWSPLHWWVWVWGFMALFSMFMMFISPYVIEPLFNKFEPLQAEGLEEAVRAMMERAGLQVGRVMQMDASRRSGHSNAYFTGIGKVKRIVLFDTLLHQMSQGEVVAVLAHEIGHWKLGHIWKRLVTAQASALVLCWSGFHMLNWPGLPGVLGLPSDLSLPARVLIIAFLGSLAMFPLTPLSAWRSRCHEREADRFAAHLTGKPQDLASALKKLSVENLSNLFPHPRYAAFHYSHPPVVERVRALTAMDEPKHEVDQSACR